MFYFDPTYILVVIGLILTMIASTKLQRAKRELEATRPYFDAIKGEIKRVFRVDYDIESKFFYPAFGDRELEPPYGYLVITSDRGLAGSYNSQVVKAAEKVIKEHGEGEIYAIGEYGRRFFLSKEIAMSKFQKTIQMSP